MKGAFNFTPTLIATLLTLVGFTFLWVFFINNITEVNGSLIKPSFEKLTVIDLTHNVYSCLSENNIINSENIQTRLDDCRNQAGVSYIEVLDIETGKKFLSGSQGSPTASHLIYENIKIEGEVHQSRLYVKK